MRHIHIVATLLIFGLLVTPPPYSAQADDAENTLMVNATGLFVSDMPEDVSALSFSPTSLDFGDIPAHSLSPAQTLTFTNTSGTPIELTAVSLISLNAPLFGGPDDVYFVYDLTNSESCVWRALGPDERWTTLNPGEACTISVRFNPTGRTSTTYLGELSVSYNTAGGSAETSTALLSGTATGPMTCDLDIPLPAGNANVNVDITPSTSEAESTRGAGSPPLVEVGQATLFQRIITAVSGCGSAYIGNPDDYVTWIAIGRDINLTVALETVTVRYLEPSSPDPGDDHGFLLLAEKEIMSDGPGAFSGDAHSNGKIDLKKGAPSTYDGTLTATGNLKIHGDNTVTGDALAGETLELKQDATVEGMAEGYAAVTPVDLPVLDFSAGGVDVNVGRNNMLMLAPGSYGKLKVEDGAELKLAHDGTSGDYFFEELELKKEATLTADVAQGSVRIHAVKKIKFEKENNVTIIGEPTAPSRYLVIKSLGDIDVKKESHLQGTLVAGGTVKLDKDVWFRGSITAEKIDLKKGVTLLHHDAPETPAAAAKFVGESDGASLERRAVAEIPADYALEANYPNPFNPQTTLAFSLPHAAEVRLVVYDVLGREVARLVEGTRSAGRHEVAFDAARLPSGVYLYRLEADGFAQTRRMLLVK